MHFRPLPAAAVVAVLVAGCGGSSTPTTTHTTRSHKPSVATSTSTTASAPTFASISHCTQLTGVGEQFAKAMAAATTGGKFDLSKVQAAYQDLANASPSAIRSDVEAIAAAFSSYAGALSKASFTIGKTPSPTQIAELEQAAKSLDTTKLRNATKAIEAWAVANCK